MLFKKFLTFPKLFVLFLLFIILRLLFSSNKFISFYLCFFILSLTIYLFIKILLNNDNIELNVIFSVVMILAFISSNVVLDYILGNRLKDVVIWKNVFSYPINSELLIYLFLCNFFICLIDLILNQKISFINTLTLVTCLILFSGFTYFALSNKIKIASYTLSEPEKYTSSKNLKIVQISDLHNTIHKNNQQELIEHVKSFNPDLIFLTGDIYDIRFDYKGTELLLEGIKNICPIYYVTGNHEFRVWNYNDIIAKITDYEICYLENKAVDININGQKITIAGIDDYFSLRRKKSNTVKNALDKIEINNNNLKILLSHRPEYFKLYQKYDYDIVFSGHAHGGQIIIPHIFNGLFAPSQGFFPKYCGGLYQAFDTSMIVSRGLSVYNLPRIFNPPELVFVTITN